MVAGFLNGAVTLAEQLVLADATVHTRGDLTAGEGVLWRALAYRGPQNFRIDLMPPGWLSNLLCDPGIDGSSLLSRPIAQVILREPPQAVCVSFDVACDRTEIDTAE